MELRIKGINRMTYPGSFASSIHLLLEPTEAIPVSIPYDQIIQTIAINICHEYGHARRSVGEVEVELGVKGPLAAQALRRLFQPSICQYKVTAAVSVDVSKTKTVALLSGEDLMMGKFIRCLIPAFADQLINN